jgi:PPP family 3-phenylpropionic acid transporter
LLLCAHWCFATAALGIYLPYFALYLRENVGLTAAQLGVVLALPPLVGLVAQPAWGQLADRTGSRVAVVVVLAAGTAAGFAALAHARGLWPTLLATVLLATFLSALFPLSTSVSFALLREPLRFGKVRVWGTIGYFIVVVAAPPLLHAVRAPLGVEARSGGPSEPGLELVFYAAALLSLLGAGAALGLPRSEALMVSARRGDLRALLAEPAFLRVLAFNTGIQLFLTGPMTLFPLYVRSRGGSMTDLSHMWICMLLLEVPLIFLSGRLFERLGTARAMTLAGAAGGVRWTVCALVPSLGYAYPLQALHALVVTGISLGVAMHVEKIAPPQLRSSAQSIVVMVGSSVGGGLSSALGGVIVQRFGVDALYGAFGLGALAFTAWSRRALLGAR